MNILRHFANRGFPVLAGLFLAFLLATASRAGTYLLDDGSVETWGSTHDGDLLALNHFDTAGETVLITGIWVVWNPLSSRVYPTVVLYSDPYPDGNPVDMVLLRAQPINLASGIIYLNQSLQYYPITPTTVTGAFFAGAFLADADSAINPTVGVDTSYPHHYGQSWIIENSSGPGKLNLSNPMWTSTLRTPLDTYINGNHMIRAEYQIVPEPSIGCVVALGLLIAIRRK